MIKVLLGALLLLPAAAEDKTFTVSGTETLDGPVPGAKPNKKLEGDQQCLALHGKLPPMDTLVVDTDGGVRWAFVYIRKGLEGKEFPLPKETVQVVQKGCLYTPHLVGARVGQPVNFVNGDPMAHNVHGIPFTNREFNYGQPPGAESTVKFPEVEVPVKVICNMHTWMATYVCVVDHPFFGVTDEKGKFTIKNLPPGDYALGIWHEGLTTFDEKNEVKITVKADLSVDFKMKRKA